MQVFSKALRLAATFAFCYLLMLGFEVAWAASGTTPCDPSTGKGSWVVTQWAEYPASGCPAYNFYYGRQEFVKATVTVGSTSTYLYGEVYCDKYAGPYYEGKAPYGCDKVAVGTPAIGPLPERAGTNLCQFVTDPYPYDYGHYGRTDGIVFMREKVVSEYLCQCDTNAVEICDGIDNNCNGQVDEGLSTDSDEDGHNTPGSCKAPSDDCNDSDPTNYPGAPELCDGKDNNCNEEIDEGLSFDVDGDGHYSVGSCMAPSDDCNDSDPKIYPGAIEVCDGKDNNCNIEIDEGLSFDVDGDGYYSPGSCKTPGGDCNDNDSKIHPGATEVCDGKDNNCNGQMEEGFRDMPEKCGDYEDNNCNGDRDEGCGKSCNLNAPV